jgi:ribosomal protein S18 acetylase RimI-like enzyme
MEIRKATKRDLDGIVELEYLLHIEHITEHGVDFKLRKNFKSIHKRFLSEKMKGGKNAFFVAHSGNELVGHISGCLDEDPPIFVDRKKGQLKTFYVKKEFRGKGLGKKLFAKLRKWFEQKKVPSIRLAVAKRNLTTKRIYKSLGFEAAHFEQLVLKMQNE